MVGLIFGRHAVLVSQGRGPQEHARGVCYEPAGVKIARAINFLILQPKHAEGRCTVDEDREAKGSVGGKFERVLDRVTDDDLGGKSSAAGIAQNTVEGTLSGDEGFELGFSLSYGRRRERVVVCVEGGRGEGGCIE